MTAEKYPTEYMVLGVHGCPVPITAMDQNDERDNPYFQMSFDRALELAKWYQKDMNCSTSIVILSYLVEGITPESLNSPMLDYVPQRIMRIENADQLGEQVKILERQLTKATKRINDLEEEKFPLVEGWGKVMDILAKLGNLIDKAKSDQAVGGKK